MKKKVYWGISIFIILLLLISTVLLIKNDITRKNRLSQIQKHLPSKPETPKTKTDVGVVSGDRPPQNAIQPEVDNNTEDEQRSESVRLLEQEFSQLSIKEIVARLEEVDSDVFRGFIELDTSWFRELIEEDAFYLSDEEQIILEVALRNAFPEGEKIYEDKYGEPLPPPGYSYGSIDGGPRQLYKDNVPHVFIKDAGASGYGHYYLLSDPDWDQYRVLAPIVLNNKELWDLWGIQVSPEVVELAKERKKVFYEKSFGTSPTVGVHALYTRETTDEDEALKQKLIAEAWEKLEAERPPKRIVSYHKEEVIALIRELEKELDQK